MADKKNTGGAVRPIHRDLGTEEDTDDCVESLIPDAMAEIADEIRAERRSEAALRDLAFKSNEAAFEYACAFMRCDVVKAQELPALVVGATHAFGTTAPAAKDGRAIQTAVLRVASHDGGFLAVSRAGLKCWGPCCLGSRRILRGPCCYVRRQALRLGWTDCWDSGAALRPRKLGRKKQLRISFTNGARPRVALVRSVSPA